MAKTIVINSSCQPSPTSVTVPHNDKIKFDNQGSAECTITFTDGQGPFGENPVKVPPGNTKEKIASNSGNWNYTTSCGTGAKAKGTVGDGDGIIIVDPPMPGSHGHGHPKHK